jgi:hypothetical protein
MRPGRAAALLLAGLLGVVVGAAAMVVLQGSPAAQPSPEPRDAVDPVKPAPVPQAPAGVLLVWSPGGLPAGLAEAVAALPRVDAATLVHGGPLELAASRDADGRVVQTTTAGFVIPLDAIAVDPASYAPFLPKGSVGAVDLGPGQAVLGRTSAGLRGLGPGGVLELADGSELVVQAVLDDELIGAAEVVLGQVPSGFTARYLLVQASGERAAVEEAIRAAVPAGVPVRIRGPGETPYLRHGDAVLPQSLVKQQFGEFSYRPGTGRDLVLEPVWAADHLETAEVPVLGRVTCHRAMLPALRGALDELRAAGLEHLVDPAGYAGCHSARRTDAMDAVSRHAWGIALDLNAADNPYGQHGDQDPRLVRTMERWGFTWGGEWLVPDPAHFEFVGPPDR